MALVCVGLAALLTLPMTLPIGAFYWDLYIYFDAANRIFDGQVPAVDFFTPVGPLGYWLFALFLKLFPAGQPLLLAQWSLLPVTMPLFALVAADIDRRSRPMALALLVPFLVFSILPFNVEEFYAFPAVDGFGIYNRQVSQLLYVLVAALVFVESRRAMFVAVTGTMLALFLVKITGFVAAVPLCAFGLAAGRVAPRTAVAAALVFLAVLGALEASLGVVSAYLADIGQLLVKNEASLLPRFLQAASIHFTRFAPLALLTGTLFVLTLRETAGAARALGRAPGAGRLAVFLDRDVFWLGLAVICGLFFETQNTGGQAFIFVWPVLLRLLARCGRWQGRRLVLVLALVAASSLPTLLQIVHRAARASVGQLQYVELVHERLGILGAVSQRTEIMTHAAIMRRAYREFPEPWAFLARNRQLPSLTLYSEPDFHLTWLMAVDEAVGAIEAYEAANGVRFGTIMALAFANPFPWLLDRQAPRHIAIGADPFRAVPDPDAGVLDSVKGTDLLLYPLCPLTDAGQTLLALYGPGLGGHARIRLSPCWDAYVRTGVPALKTEGRDTGRGS